jgi:hypothetical protein
MVTPWYVPCREAEPFCIVRHVRARSGTTTPQVHACAPALVIVECNGPDYVGIEMQVGAAGGVEDGPCADGCVGQGHKADHHVGEGASEYEDEQYKRIHLVYGSAGDDDELRGVMRVRPKSSTRRKMTRLGAFKCRPGKVLQ